MARAERSAGDGEGEGVFSVHACNRQVVDAFIELWDAWTWLLPPMGEPRRMGLDRTQFLAQAEINEWDRQQRRVLWTQLRAMESAARSALYGDLGEQEKEA